MCRCIGEYPQTCQRLCADSSAVHTVINNMYEDIRDLMEVFAEFENLSGFEQVLRAKDFEKRRAKAEKAIDQAEARINVSFAWRGKMHIETLPNASTEAGRNAQLSSRDGQSCYKVPLCASCSPSGARPFPPLVAMYAMAQAVIALWGNMKLAG